MFKQFKLWEAERDANMSKAAVIKKVNDNIKDLYMVPDFKKFSREGEPDQESTLFSDVEGYSFSLNFAGGNLYSIDFWAPTSKRAESTLYMQDQDLDYVLSNLVTIMKNPKPGLVELSESVITLNEFKGSKTKSTIILDKPEKGKEKIEDKAAVEIDKKIKQENKKEPEYDYGDKDTIFSDLREYIKMVIKGEQPALLITGAPGIGKTYIVNDEIKKANLEKGKDWVKVKGKSSAAAMYISLYKNNGKLIIYDDCDSVFEDPDGVNTLKGALDSAEEEREITWGSARPIKDPETGKQIPSTFLFSGRVIFISNIALKNFKNIGAIKSRSFVLEVALSPQDMVKYIEEKLPEIQKNIPMSIKKTAMNTIKSVAAVDEDIQLNMRTVLKAIKILKNIPDLTVAKRMIVQQCSFK